MMSQDSWGIEKTYEDAAGQLHEVSDEALAAVSTHDLPERRHLERRGSRGPATCRRQTGSRRKREVPSKLLETSGVEAGADVTGASVKTFEQLAEAPSMIVLAELEAAGMTAERPSMPSACGKYPNWSLVLPVTLEELHRVSDAS